MPEAANVGTQFDVMPVYRSPTTEPSDFYPE
jgi:hypothetical protein